MYAVALDGEIIASSVQTNLDAFKANPAKYEPAYGDFCAYGVALGGGSTAIARYWKVVDGKLYLNLNGDIQAEWSKDITGNVTKADTNWGRICSMATLEGSNSGSNRRLRIYPPKPVPHRKHTMVVPSSDIAFTTSVKSVQERRGSRAAYARNSRPKAAGPQRSTPNSPISSQACEWCLPGDGEQGWTTLRPASRRTPRLPACHRRKKIASAAFRGNRQSITTGNIAENPRALIFLMDYQHRQRVKISGTSRVIEDDPELVGRSIPEGHKARPEAAILFTVEAWGANCSQHIPQMLFAEEVAATVGSLKHRIGVVSSSPSISSVLRKPVTFTSFVV